MAYSNTHPAIAYGTTPDVTTDHFKQQILRACDYPLPSPTSRRYARVKVLLLYWDNDHLRVENEVARMRDAFLQGYHYSCEIDRIPAHGNELPTTWLTRRLVNLATNMDTSDLIIFYYAGHACTGTQYQEGPCIFLSGTSTVTCYDGTPTTAQEHLDFSKVKAVTLDPIKADVLYLLDCCHASTAAIGPGKELIAACTTIEEVVPGPSYSSFTASVVEQLNSAANTGNFLTAAQLWFKLLDTKSQGKLPRTPVHAEAASGRSSIFLAPLTAAAAAQISPYSLSGTDPIPLGWKKSDLRAMLSVRLRDGNASTMKQWLTTQRPHGIGVSVEYAPPSSSILVFTMPAPAYYCLPSHPACQFMAYVRLPENRSTPSCRSVRSPMRENERPSQSEQGKSV